MHWLSRVGFSRRGLRIWALTLALALAPGALRSADAPRRPVIGVVPKGATHAFWKSIHAGALQDTDWAGRVKFVGFDSSEVLVKALERGELHGLVLQNPFAMGYEGVRAVVRHLRGEPVPRRIDTGAAVATAGLSLRSRLRALLEPDWKPWLKE
jgi:ABC-type sugar transport system substrate-binding protein